LLDEPTNHLDLGTREALTLALAQFEGTLILVSHDRALLRATTDRFLLVSDGRCTDFDGDLDDYRAWSLKKTADTPRATSAAPVAAPVPTAPAPAPTSREQRRVAAESRGAAARERKPIEQRIRRIETKLAEAEQAKKAIDEALASPGIYDDASKERLKQALIDQAYLKRDIEILEAEWLEQQALLERAA
jgi:ATP-binding cassette subfamily F protein 3